MTEQTASAKIVLGIDIGGTGIKGAPVNVETGELLCERVRIDTPQPATPEAVGAVVKQLVDQFNWQGPIGCTFPAIVHNGVTLSAANVDASWLNAPAQDILSQVTGLPLKLINDADAAGLAEGIFGAAKGKAGKVLVITLGTGIGSALIVDGKLISNTEFGHLIFKNNEIAEKYCSGKVKDDLNLKWKEYSQRLNEYVQHLQLLLSPDLLIIGGGISKKHEKFIPELTDLRFPVVPAELKNDAGIVGAALEAAREFGVL
ncbi:ROK family protein [Iodobacter sp. LRB]|uniref:Polyphosphate glucokinase n=2 Tax=Iodobacter TaxID=32014 RepID=A0A377SU75_9NEIS|nr:MULTISPECIES: ROK family protein [Iodobacter]NHQ87150.1 ROK family protein [Iodobacter violacea]PHV03026.1 polyphosphate glucokinase [Iodobacter sp. BJB302]TCU82058.1 polyphosphate glucokinase [Iodobacter fluviatilis]STR44848.1 Polyphosphate glucokinase [Iodobacter fluviatilis]